MTIQEIYIKNFKSLYETAFCPGKVNVFRKIHYFGGGWNLSAAMTDRVNNNSLQRKGIRLSASPLYRSRFRSIEEGLTADFGIKWTDDQDYDYLVRLTTPKDDDVWTYYSESLCGNGSALWGRSCQISPQSNNSVQKKRISWSPCTWK